VIRVVLHRELKIQGQAVNSCTFVVDPDGMKKLLQADNGLRSDRSKERK